MNSILPLLLILKVLSQSLLGVLFQHQSWYYRYLDCPFPHLNWSYLYLFFRIADSNVMMLIIFLSCIECIPISGIMMSWSLDLSLPYITILTIASFD